MVSRTAALPYSTIENIGLAVPECILLTCTIFLFSFSLLKKKAIRSIYPLVFMTLFVFAGTARDIYTKRSGELVIYNTPGLANIGIRTGKILNLYSDSATIAGDVNKHCATLGLKIEPRVLDNGYHLVRSEHENILITNRLNNDAFKGLNPDIIILTSREPVIESDFHPAKSCSVIVVTSGVRSGFLPLNDVDTALCKIHYIKKSGAFIRRI
jgi:hypothetical protein